ncbi:MAG: cell wall-binding repeat-containing protein [Chloroflexi bacterium]|nr:cell wall-binding repeat-containing protein [Chloroflexota bacterium]
MIPARRRCGRALLAFLVVAAGALVAPAPSFARPASIERLVGADRYATAAAISRATFAPGVAVAYIATGLQFPDSLAGGPAAARRGSPILLTDPRSLPQATRDELTRLNPKAIVILGGRAVVSGTVESQLAAYTDGSVTRIAGSDRHATSALISARHFPTGVPVAYVATGRTFPDALSAGAAAAALGGPVLLVDTNDLPASVRSELTRLRPARIVVVGGRSVVGDAVVTALDRYTTGTVTRQAGADRFATAAAVSASAFPSAPTAFIANGMNFPDAVTGVPAAARAGAPLLLATRTNLPSATAGELKRLDPARVVLLGGQVSLSDAIIPAIEKATELARVGPHTFRVDSYRLQEVPETMLAYNGSTIVPLYGDRDSSGAFIYRHSDGRWYDHPVGQAQYVVNMLRNHRLDPKPEYLDLALANGNRLLQRAVRHQGALFFPYSFDFNLHGRGVMDAPWYSGMAQGVALSGFVRLWEVTGDEKWMTAARDTFLSFRVSRQAGKPWFAVVENGSLWFEEYPWLPYDHTFNGHNFAIYGVYDYWRVTRNREAELLALGGIATSARVAGTVRTPGGISHYCIAQSCLDRKVRTAPYHLTHIGQFVQLHRYTAHETFAKQADTFTADNPDYRLRGTVAFQAGEHVAYRFDSAGVGTPAQRTTLSGPSSAPYSQRTVPYGWIRPGNGIWFFMSDGAFDGLWIRESSRAYARGFVDRLTYYWARRLSVGSGSRIGYTFDSGGAITGQKTVSTSATTWQYTSRAKINGQLAALLVNGPLAGYWLPITANATAGVEASDAPMISAEAGTAQDSGERGRFAAAEPPLPPEDPLIPPPMPGQQDLTPANEPPADEPWASP